MVNLFKLPPTLSTLTCCFAGVHVHPLPPFQDFLALNQWFLLSSRMLSCH